jgi:phytoene desaturase
MTASRRQRIAVVGAGPGGLATALRLVAQGYEVAVFEARDRVGGRMGGLQDGAYAWDTGPTILQLPRLYDDLFAQAGLQRADYIPFLPVEPYTRVQFWDHTHLDLTTDQTQLKAQLAAMRPDLPAAFDRWYAQQQRQYERGYELYLGQPARPMLDYIRLNELPAALGFRPWETLYQHFWQAFQDERLVYAFSYPAKYLGMHPTVSASVFSLIPYIELADGVWHPQGGFRALAQAIARAITDLGGRIHLNCPVQRIALQGTQAQGVVLGQWGNGRRRWGGGEWGLCPRRAGFAARLGPGQIQRSLFCPQAVLLLHVHAVPGARSPLRPPAPPPALPVGPYPPPQSPLH